MHYNLILFGQKRGQIYAFILTHNTKYVTLEVTRHLHKTRKQYN